MRVSWVAIRAPPLRVIFSIWASINRQETQHVDTSNIITGLRGSGRWVQVGRNALPLFNAGLVGTQRQTLYLHSSPMRDVSNFGNDILFPVLVRDAVVGAFVALAMGVFVGLLPNTSLLAMLALPLLVRAIRASELGASGQQRAIAMIDVETAQLHAAFGLLLVIGLTLAVFFVGR